MFCFSLDKYNHSGRESLTFFSKSNFPFFIPTKQNMKIYLKSEKYYFFGPSNAKLHFASQLLV
jgi:hypothetical protein